MGRALRAAARAVAGAEARLRAVQESRDEAVREALKAGWSLSSIAEHVGVSKGRISQIASGTG